MNEQNSNVGAIGRVRAWFSRWQEFVIWLPVLCALAIVGYVVLGAIARVGADPLAWLAEIPVMCAWAAVAAAAAWLIKRTYLLDLDVEMERELHFRVREHGDPNAMWLLILDRLEWFVLLLLMFAFFWPAR